MRCEIVRTTEKALLWWLQMYFCPAMGGFFACRPFLWNVPGARAFFVRSKTNHRFSHTATSLFFSRFSCVESCGFCPFDFAGVLWYTIYRSILHTDSTCSVLLDGGRNMFAVGDNVLYGADGVCTITEHGMRDFFGSTREYYIFSAIACCV